MAAPASRSPASCSPTWPRPSRPPGRGARCAAATSAASIVVEPAAIAVVDGRIAAVGTPDDVRAAPPDLERRRRPRPHRDPGPGRLPHAPGLRRRPRRRVRPARAGRRLRAHPRRRAAASPRPSRRPAGSAREGLRAAVAATWAGWRRTARRRPRASPATASTATPSSRACAAIAAPHPIEAVPTYLGAHSVPPEFADGDEYLDFAIAEVLPEAARDRRGGRRVPRAGRVQRRAGRALPARRGRPRPGAAHARRPVHRGGGDPARDRARRAVGRPPRGDRAGGVARLAASDVAGVLLPGRGALPAPDACRRRGR